MSWNTLSDTQKHASFAAGRCLTALATQLFLDHNKRFSTRLERGLVSCAINAGSHFVDYHGLKWITKNEEIAWKGSMALFGVQTAANLVNIIGDTAKLYENPAFNAIALPLNFAASPMESSAGFVYHTTASLFEDKRPFKLGIYGGALYWNHTIGPGSSWGANMGGFGGTQLQRFKDHELAHVVLQSTPRGNLDFFTSPLTYWLYTDEQAALERD